MIANRMRPAYAAAVAATAVMLDVWFSACGSPTAPTPADPVRLTIVLTTDGVSPGILKAPMCGNVVIAGWCHFVIEFVNRDTVPHQVRSDPHPGHSDCPGLNLDAIAPGQSNVSSDLSACYTSSASGRGYHDETRPDDPRFQGRVQ